MMRRLVQLVLLVVVLVSLVPAMTRSAFAAPAFSRNVVQLSWFYKPPSSNDLTTLSQKFDNFILTRNDESIRDQIKAKGVTTPFLQYIRFEAIMDPGSCTAQPWRNQVAYNPGDFCMIRDQHPDWFLRGADGAMLQEGGWYYMNPANAGWRAFWLERARVGQEQKGWDGVFLDNVEGSLDKHERRGWTVQGYPTDASFQNAVRDFLAYLYNGYFKPQGRPLQANVIETPDPAVWHSYTPFLDGAMEEGWGVDWNTGYYSASKWNEHLGRVERMQREGKRAVLVAQGGKTDYNRQHFAYASYLLVANGDATFRYANDDFYHEIWLYDNYNIDLGQPLGARYQQGNVWKRDFTGGTVTVDPVAHTASIKASPMANLAPRLLVPMVLDQ